jgi:hypothetical protein
MHEPTPFFVCVFDKGSLELGLNHLQSLVQAGIEDDDYCAYVSDRDAYDAVKSRGFQVEWLQDVEHLEMSKRRKDFGTRDFIEYSFMRYGVIHDLLVKKNRPVWYMDVDTVVLKNLTEVFRHSYRELEDSTDIMFQDDGHMICSGCILFFPNETTKRVTKHIYDHMNDRVPDQHFFAQFLSDKSLVGRLYDERRMGCQFATTLTMPRPIRVRILDTALFPNGLLYFDREDKIEVPDWLMQWKMDYRNKAENMSPAFVHANWMVGNDVKKSAIQSAGLWFV